LYPPPAHFNDLVFLGLFSYLVWVQKKGPFENRRVGYRICIYDVKSVFEHVVNLRDIAHL
jgi:hypothetical protein